MDENQARDKDHWMGQFVGHWNQYPIIRECFKNTGKKFRSKDPNVQLIYSY